ncbi:MAG: DUF2188 domain-containing protein [bacterium]
MSKSNGAPIRLEIVLEAGVWFVRPERGEGSTSSFRTKGEAFEFARLALRESGGKLLIQDRGGRISEREILGHAAMDRISAVEGIAFTGDMKRDFEAVNDLPDDERRTQLLKKYAKK